MDVCFDQFLVPQFEPGGCDRSCHHQIGFSEEILIMLASLATEAHHQSRLTATTSTTAALRVVRWCGRDVTKMHDVEVAYVHSEFHRWGAEESSQIAATEACLTVLA